MAAGSLLPAKFLSSPSFPGLEALSGVPSVRCVVVDVLLRPWPVSAPTESCRRPSVRLSPLKTSGT